MLIFVVRPVERFEFPRAFPAEERPAQLTEFVYSSVVDETATRPVVLLSASDPTSNLTLPMEDDQDEVTDQLRPPVSCERVYTTTSDR